MPESQTAYHSLLELLHQHGVAYRTIAHAPEGRTDIVSAMRGHPTAQAAKCIMVLVKLGRKQTKYALAVVPGDARVDLGALKTLLSATYVGFATPAIAEELGKTLSGTILPFVLDDRVELIVEPRLLEFPEMYFNAGRLDLSVAVRTDDYTRIAKPRLARIAGV